MNVTIIGSHNIDLTGEIVSKMASYMVVLSQEDKWGNHGVSIRAPRGSTAASSPVEASVVHLAEALALNVYWVRPHGTTRADVFTRDYSLVESSDRVLAFFRHDRIMEGGTGHVVHAALVRGIPVEAWVSNQDGGLEGVGSDDGFEISEEDSRWMQIRFLERQQEAAETAIQEAMFRVGPAGIVSTATPLATYVGTITGASTEKSTGLITTTMKLNDLGWSYANDLSGLSVSADLSKTVSAGTTTFRLP